MAGAGGFLGGSLGSGTGSTMQDMFFNGIQNTNKQEYNQRQALFQNLVGAADDSAWLMQHFPNFANWTPTGGGTGGYQAGSNAPQAYAGTHYSPNVAQSSNQMASANDQQAQADYYKYITGQGQGQSSGGYSSLWS